MKEQLIVEVVTDAKKAVADLKQYTEHIQKTEKRVGSITKLMKSYWAEALVVYASVRKLVNIAKSLTSAYMKQEESVAKLNASLRATGLYTPSLSDEIQELAAQLQRTTRYGDEVTLGMAGFLQSLGKLDSEGLKKTIPLVMDFAEGMQVDLNTAASLIGKTLGSTTNALSRYGIVLDMSGTKSEKLAELTKAVNESFGGMAEAMGETYTGKVAKLQNAFGDLKEAMGGVIADRMEPMLPLLTDLTVWTTNLINEKRELRAAYDMLEASMGKVNDATALEITQAKILIATDQLRDLEQQKRLERGTSVLGTLKDEISTIEQSIMAKREEIRALAQLEDSQKAAIRMRDEEAEAVAEAERRKMDYYEAERKELDELLEKGEQFDESMVMSGDILEAYVTWHQETKIAMKNTKEAVEELDEAIVHSIPNWKFYTAQYEMLAAGSEQLTEAVSKVVPPFKDQADAYAMTAQEGKSVADTIKDLNEKAEEQANNILPMWAGAWKTMGDSTMSMAERMKEIFKDLVATWLEATGKELLVRAFKALIPLPGVFNPGGAALAFAGSAAAFTAAGFVRSLQQGGIVNAERKQEGGMLYGDRIPVMAERGEMVIPKEIVANEAPALGAIMTGGKTMISNNIYLDKKVLFRAITEGAEDGQFRTHARSIVR